MYACPWCGYAHPSQMTASQCMHCQQSFADLYICPSHDCAMHHQFQMRSRQCHTCERILIGEFSGRDIAWGHAVYRVREYIGGGGMGEVYRAIEQNNTNTYQREVAIKFNKNMMDLDVVKRFKLEVQVLSILQNPHNIRVYTYGELFEERHTGTEVRAQFMVMELLKGYTLDEIVKDRSLEPVEIARVFIEICGALAEAHQKGVIHRDIKPHNIMLQSVGIEKFAKVFDFGLSRMTNSMDDRLSTSGVVMGTFRYMSPEQALGEDLDHRTDIFSLGVVLYETLAGVAPFNAKNLFELFMLHQEGAPPLGGGLPEFEEIVMKMLAYEPAERFQSMEEVRQSLQLLSGDSLSGKIILPDSVYSSDSGGVLTKERTSLRERFQETSTLSSKAHTLPTDQVRALQGNETSMDSVPNSNSSVKTGRLALFLVLGLLFVGGGFGAYMWMQPPEIQPNARKVGPQKRSGVGTQFSMSQGQPLKTKESQRKREVTTPRQPVKRVRTKTPPPRDRKAKGTPPRRETARERRIRRQQELRKLRERRRKEAERRRKEAERRRKELERRRKELAAQRRKAPPRIVPRAVVVRPRPRPIIPRPRPVVLRPRPRPVIPRPRPVVRKKVAVVVLRPRPRPRPTCPARSGKVLYRQLDRAMGASLNSRTSRLLNKGAGSTVYDAGLSLSPSWRQAPVLCKRSHLCSRIKRLVNSHCRRYRPLSHCKGYTAKQVGSKFVCSK